VSITELDQVPSERRFLLTVGDRALDDKDRDLIARFVESRLQAFSSAYPPGTRDAEIRTVLKKVIPSIERTVAKLQERPLCTHEQKNEFLANELPRLLEQEDNQTIRVARNVGLANYGSPLFRALDANLEDRIVCLGSEEAERDLTGKSRDKFQHAHYLGLEARKIRFFQYRNTSYQGLLLVAHLRRPAN
jgi:hypothetical protein